MILNLMEWMKDLLKILFRKNFEFIDFKSFIKQNQMILHEIHSTT